ncbi:MAG: DEAD/DEAH box helicase [Verrucomicrobiales bacterium]
MMIKSISKSSAVKTSSEANHQITGAVEAILGRSGFAVAGTQVLSGREATLAPVPALLHPEVRQALQADYPAGIYSHQALAIEQSLAGRDVCQATSTASGKSLPFMAVASHLLLSDPMARVLALYPAKALIQDQMAKWSTLLGPLGHKPGFIDGSIPLAKRQEILARHRVVLMTPDVAHAWLMSNLNVRAVKGFRSNLRLLILDEAHVYDGVFGTNMAFFLRRLQAVSSPHRFICSTATLGEPARFIEQLTGRSCLEIGPAQEGSRMAQRDILLARSAGGDNFEASATLLRSLAREFPGRFLAFGDSRRLVETLTAATHRQESSAHANADDSEGELDGTPNFGHGVLPYRAGYEAEDRRQIQAALGDGTLRGVIATSALEMGIDIGEIDLVVLLDTPSSMKSFWQRLGRAGRRQKGCGLIIDSREAIKPNNQGLADYLARPIEPNWLYLHNRYIQFSNGLCAAAEIGQINGSFDRSYFASLPGQFSQFLENELNPTTIVPADLYPLKQAAQEEPHWEFPLRNSAEKNYRIVTRMGENRGEISFSQSLREAYPGAVYYYMATPYRVVTINNRDRTIVVERERAYTTKPIHCAMVFLDFSKRTLRLRMSKTGFLAEAEMQVRERVSGFKEKRGQAETTHNYGNGSSHHQKPLDRLFHTSGVCWYLPKASLVSDAVAQSIMQAFCAECGIHARDVGVGRFHSPKGPEGFEVTKGVCIYDNANGSLRLTERLAENFTAIVKSAISTERLRGNDDLAATLDELLAEVNRWKEVRLQTDEPAEEVANATGYTGNAGDCEEWVSVIAPGEKAILYSASGNQEVTVLHCLYNPKGLHYQLACDREGVKWMAPIGKLEPILGETKFTRFNMMTGELAGV